MSLIEQLGETYDHYVANNIPAQTLEFEEYININFDTLEENYQRYSQAIAQTKGADTKVSFDAFCLVAWTNANWSILN